MIHENNKNYITELLQIIGIATSTSNHHFFRTGSGTKPLKISKDYEILYVSQAFRCFPIISVIQKM